MFNDNPIFTLWGKKFNFVQFVEKYSFFLTKVKSNPYALLKTIPFTFLVLFCSLVVYVQGFTSNGISFFIIALIVGIFNLYFLIYNSYVFFNYFFMKYKIKKYLNTILKLEDKQPFFNAINFKNLDYSAKESILRDMQIESFSLGNLLVIGRRLQTNYINKQINMIDNKKIDDCFQDINFFSSKKKTD